jgi:hypothetical protein
MKWSAPAGGRRCHPALPLLLLFLLLPAGAARAEVPVRTEEMIWTVLAWNGRDYSATFAAESSDSISLLSGVDNFLSARATLVYWWPATAEWRTDTESLNIQFPGTLEVRDTAGTVITLALQQYTYFNIQGEYELNWRVLTGDAAQKELERYASLYDSYFKATQAHQLATAAYENEAQGLAAQIQKRKNEGRDYAALLKQLQDLAAPPAPAAPAYYVVPPTEMQRAFIVNLPVGRYTIRLVNPDGSVMEGTEKTLSVHDRTRGGGVGYEVIPSDKWTRTESSATPSSVVYVSGGADLYVRPFFESEYNDLAYERTVKNSARGNPNIVKWVRVQQVPHATIELSGAAKSLVTEAPFVVEQSQGTSLGYTITAYDPKGAHKGKAPNLIAFKVPLSKGAGNISLRAMDAKGAPLAGSERQIRVVGPIAAAPLLLSLALLPLLVMLLVLALRGRAYGAGRASEQD